MFSKSREPEPVPAPQPPQKRLQRQNVPSIISADLTVTGTLVATGDVQIDGCVEGDIRANAVVVGEDASVRGDIYAEEAVVRGRIDGSIRARKVQLCATSHVEGNILHQALTVEAGAFFEGNCRHSENPLADAADTPAVPRRAAPVPQPAKPANSPAPSMFETGGTGSEEPLGAPARAAASFTPIKS